MSAMEDRQKLISRRYSGVLPEQFSEDRQHQIEDVQLKPLPRVGTK